MEHPVEPVFQVIDADLNYVQDFERFIIKRGLADIGTDYKTISIIGPQSSGKSTFLNRVFETKFQEMDERKMQQTTQGVWLSCSKAKRIFIMDLEGSDSLERGDDRKTFEQTTALLALAFSDLMFINMWERDVKRAQGSSMEILKTIFEINLKLFQQEGAKKIVFLVRDFKGGKYPQERLENMRSDTEARLEKMWDEIAKPEKYQGTSFKKFFYFRFETMPCIDDEDEFEDRIKHWRAQICDESSSQYIMGDVKSTSNMPVDGLPLFLQNSWDKIRSDKDINLPSQKELVSSLRCNEFKMEAIAREEETLKSLAGQAKRKYFPGFAQVADNLILNALEFYQGSARHYSKKVFEEVQDALIRELQEKLFLIFQDQLILLDKQAYEIWKEKSKELIRPESVSTHFNESIGKIINYIVADFKSKAQKLTIKGANWTEEQMVENLIERLDGYANSLKETELQKLHELTKGKIQKELGQRVHETIVEFDQNFWDALRQSYMDVVSGVIRNVESILVEGFDLEEHEAKARLNGLEAESYGLLKKKLMQECNDLNTVMREKFTKTFRQDEKGLTRDWKAMEEDAIKKLFVDSKDQLLETLKLFSKFEVTAQEISNEGRTSKGFSVDGGHVELLDQRQLEKIKTRFEEDIEMIFDQAINKHYGRGGGKVPWYFWLVALFFGYEKLLSYVYSPIILYPLVLLGGVLAMLHSMGLSGVVLGAGRLGINRFFRRMNLNFHL